MTDSSPQHGTLSVPLDACCIACGALVGGLPVPGLCPGCQAPLSDTYAALTRPRKALRPVTPHRSKQLAGAAIMFLPAAAVLGMLRLAVATGSTRFAITLLLIYPVSLTCTLCIPAWLRRQEPASRFLAALGPFATVALLFGLLAALAPVLLPFIALGQCLKTSFG